MSDVTSLSVNSLPALDGLARPPAAVAVRFEGQKRTRELTSRGSASGSLADAMWRPMR
jgi:hypothetical protein